MHTQTILPAHKSTTCVFAWKEMGFFNNPGKAFKGCVKDPIGRIGKDLGKIGQPAQVFLRGVSFDELSIFRRRAHKGRMPPSYLERLEAHSMAGSPVLCEEPQPVPRMDATKACTTTRRQNNEYWRLIHKIKKFGIDGSAMS